MQPPVAIVLVNYRCTEDTLRCAASLESLTYPNVRLVVVENASGDGSLERLRAGLPRGVTLIAAETNAGYTGGNNLGIAHALAAGAAFVHVLNPDTVVHDPDYLTKLVAHLRAHPRVGAVGPKVYLREVGRVQNTRGRFPWLWRRVADRFHKRRAEADSPAQVETLNGVCVLIRRHCLEQVGGYDERLFAYVDEAEWAARAAAAGWTLHHLPVESIVHLQREDGYGFGGRTDYLLKRNVVYFLLKNRRYLQAAGYTAFALTLSVLRSLRRREFRWCRRLTTTYAGLWTGRWNRVMGHPG